MAEEAGPSVVDDGLATSVAGLDRRLQGLEGGMSAVLEQLQSMQLALKSMQQQLPAQVEQGHVEPLPSLHCLPTASRCLGSRTTPTRQRRRI
eukprot:3180747-Prymnesium_polylepis.1